MTTILSNKHQVQLFPLLDLHLKASDSLYNCIFQSQAFSQKLMKFELCIAGLRRDLLVVLNLSTAPVQLMRGKEPAGVQDLAVWGSMSLVPSQTGTQANATRLWWPTRVPVCCLGCGRM